MNGLKTPNTLCYIAQKFGNWPSECSALFKVHFEMSHDYGGQKVYEIVKYEHPDSGFKLIIPTKIWHLTSVWKITFWTHKG